MPTIRDLVLTISRDSNKRVAAEVTYNLEFTAAEIAADIEYEEVVFLYERLGNQDRHYIETSNWGGGEAFLQRSTSQDPGDAEDSVIATLYQETHRITSLGLGGSAGTSKQVPRSFKRVLTGEELAKLTQVGREYAYTVVFAVPSHISGDVQVTGVEIDIGDPGE